VLCAFFEDKKNSTSTLILDEIPFLLQIAIYKSRSESYTLLRRAISCLTYINFRILFSQNKKRLRKFYVQFASSIQQRKRAEELRNIALFGSHVNPQQVDFSTIPRNIENIALGSLTSCTI